MVTTIAFPRRLAPDPEPLRLETVFGIGELDWVVTNK